MLDPFQSTRPPIGGKWPGPTGPALGLHGGLHNDLRHLPERFIEPVVRSLRLSVRTPDFHFGKTGSTPVESATFGTNVRTPSLTISIVSAQFYGPAATSSSDEKRTRYQVDGAYLPTATIAAARVVARQPRNVSLRRRCGAQSTDDRTSKVTQPKQVGPRSG